MNPPDAHVVPKVPPSNARGAHAMLPVRALAGIGRLAVLAAVTLAASAHGAPTATAYTLLPAHSSLTYTFTQAGAANHGRFNTFTVRFDPAAGRLAVLIDMRSFDTGDSQRNAILGGRDFFDVARYPRARFTATRLTRTATGYRAVGALTLRGVTRTVVVPFTWRIADIGGRRVGLLTGRTTIRRLDFGIGQGEWHSTGWVGNAVTIRYALRFSPAATTGARAASKYTGHRPPP